MMAQLQRPQSPSVRIIIIVGCVYFFLLDVLKVQAFSAVAPLYSDAITPFHSPEDVVRKQLDAFTRSDIKTAFECGSQEHQLECGPTSHDFKDLLLSEPAFSTLIGHTKSTVLMITDSEDGEGKCCYVRIVPSKWKAISSSSDTHHQHQLHKRSCLEYWFELSKTTTPTQQDGEEEDAENNNEEGCWRIDSILPDFEDLSLVSFEEEDDDADEDDHDGIYYVNNVDNNTNDADHDDDHNDHHRQIGNDIDEISQIIIENMIERTVHPAVLDVDADDDEDDGETFVNIIQNLIVDNTDEDTNNGVTEYE